MTNGGPAFPRDAEWVHQQGTAQSVHWQGMCLRDYFAAEAISRLLPMDLSLPIPIDYFKNIAQTAYAVADAMLKERDKA